MKHFSTNHCPIPCMLLYDLFPHLKINKLLYLSQINDDDNNNLTMEHLQYLVILYCLLEFHQCQVLLVYL